MKSRLNLFYGKRKDQQIKTSKDEKRPDSSIEWIDYMNNAAKGSYYGLESELDYYPQDTLHLYTKLGLAQG